MRNTHHLDLILEIDIDAELLTTAQAAKYLGIAQSTLRGYSQKKLIRPVGRKTEGRGKTDLYQKSDLDQLIANSRFIQPTEQSRQGRSAYFEKLERKTEDERHPSGCIIHWSTFHRDEKSAAWVTITCASCKQKYEKREGHMRQAIKKGEFTGCCNKCYGANRKPPALKSKGYITRRSYIFRHKRTFTSSEWQILSQMNPNNGIYIPEHRAIVAIHLDRPLLPNEGIHHINGNKTDNHIENLQLFSMKKLGSIHSDSTQEKSALLLRINQLEQTIRELQDKLLRYESYPSQNRD